MTDSNYAGKHLALDEYKKDTPPGWEPFLAWYPLKNYFEHMELWGHMITSDGHRPSMSLIGPAVIARLRGPARRLAMKVEFTFPNNFPYDVDAHLAGLTYSGTQAIVLEGLPPNATTGFPGLKSGLELILQKLDDRYGKDTQDITDEALDRFFECVRGGGQLMDYITAFKLRHDTAEEKAGLQINNVGLTHRFLHGAGLNKNFVSEVMLKIDHDSKMVNGVTRLPHLRLIHLRAFAMHKWLLRICVAHVHY